VRYALPLLGLVLVAGCGSSKPKVATYDRAKVVRCLRSGGSSFVDTGRGVVRANVPGEQKFATLAEVDVAFGPTSKQALGRLRLNYFFRTNPKAKPYVHGRFVGNVAYAITTLPFLKPGPKGLDAARARVRAKAQRLVDRCLAAGRD
jgi:hypothetical protein